MLAGTVAAARSSTLRLIRSISSGNLMSAQPEVLLKLGGFAAGLPLLGQSLRKDLSPTFARFGEPLKLPRFGVDDDCAGFLFGPQCR